MRYYPLFLELQGQPVVVVGGGAVAARKTRALLDAGAVVTVVSPTLGPALRRSRRIVWIARNYRPGDLRGARLVVAATDNLVVNEQICRAARRRGLLVNCAAPPAAGNFIVPAQCRRGQVAIAISTGGLNPGVAKQLRRELEAYLRRHYARLRIALGNRHRS